MTTQMDKIFTKPLSNEKIAKSSNTIIADSYFSGSQFEKVGLAEIDFSIYKWLKEDLNLQIKKNNEPQSVDIYYRTSERFNALKRDRDKRDQRSGKINLPYLVFHRIRVATNSDIGFNVPRQYEGFDTIIHQKYNKNNIYATLKIDRINFNPKNAIYNKAGIIDLYSIPFPKFLDLDYEVEIKASYEKEMNSILEQVSDVVGGGKNVFIENNNNTRIFELIIDDFSNTGNEDDYTSEERSHTYTTTVTCKAYLIPEYYQNKRKAYKITRTPLKIQFKEKIS